MVMRPLRLFALAVLAAGVVACAGVQGRPPPTVEAPPSVLAPAPDAPAHEQVVYAFRLLMAYYVKKPEAAKLLQAAWEGAQSQLHPGTPEGARPRLALPPDRAAAEAAFASALADAIAATPGADARGVAFAAIKAMARSLDDDHTYFLMPEAYELYMANETVGLGYSGLNLPEGTLVWYVYPGGPADKAGLRPGDLVVSMDGQPTVRDPSADSEREPLRAGVPVDVLIDRPGAGQFETIAVPERSRRRVLDWQQVGDAGYVRLYRFPAAEQLLPDGKSVVQELEAALRELRNGGVRGIVLDLRNNPGGSELTAANVAGRLGVTGKFIENERRDGGRAEIGALGEDALGGLPLAVLVNENTASSAELLASTLQQLGLARVFGHRTSGVVNTARLWAVAGGGLFITTEKAYAGPRETYLDRRGVTPDEAVTLDRAELAGARDTQLQAALAWLRSRAGAAVGGR
jgi:carboxyl-terminal processing protease